MRLTTFTDYALRLLIYTAGKPESRVTIDEVAEWFAISRAHVKKVVLTLSRGGFLLSSKGRNGGFTLARPPGEINLSEVILATEPDFGLFECYLTGNECRISRPCRLPNVANEALAAFLAVLGKYTLADAMLRPAYFLLPAAGPQPLRGPKRPATQDGPGLSPGKVS
ncbi:RrF2 family transcriptional regulator [Rhodobacter capsulatus]|uniref:Transcriptional regulator, BadM/Rrf2 family n=1 Tax=Rhodobacter capsulatus (strain ATCC BAA-309 / NBRC 16581 / SB1003) TaxID=272942 RepID=D5AVJ9_RHOCB|nr:Rrf2 family transcriptional regulator [Rhodobacter capsulatus]ADE87334.1 transcriptional regulator, BadM/Rrf2 family [Rhodobacter capsulatus SB 1003]ETD75554.1 Rrf2 family transcriptional regulator [Rhodobacter capsulatus B6]MDS0926902.1 Rrf2 family transcriptional regulator [Rhodobacter capsulatus]